jgi:hypothetical protein
MTLNRIFTVAVLALVLGGVIAGFIAIGPPSAARAIALDRRRVEDLMLIADRIKDQKGPLPLLLTRRATDPHDPVSGAPYLYGREDATHYQLCATFATAAGTNDSTYYEWNHPAGTACFRIAQGSAVPIGPAFRLPAPRNGL